MAVKVEKDRIVVDGETIRDAAAELVGYVQQPNHRTPACGAYTLDFGAGKDAAGEPMRGTVNVAEEAVEDLLQAEDPVEFLAGTVMAFAVP